jgi:hypothetical protein
MNKMNKILPILIVVIVILTIQEGKAQTFQLLKPISVPDSVYGKPEDATLVSYSEVKNITANSASYKIALSPVYLVPGHLYSICDCANCYMPQEGFYQTPNPCPLEPGATSGAAIYLDLYPNNVEGTSIINVSFYNVNNQVDVTTYVAVFIVGGMGINEPVEPTLLKADISPNPATDKVLINNIPYFETGSAKLEIFDTKGNKVNTQIIYNSNSSCDLNTTDFTSGLYWYIITDNEKPLKAGNFIISK